MGLKAEGRDGGGGGEGEGLTPELNFLLKHLFVSYFWSIGQLWTMGGGGGGRELR